MYNNQLSETKKENLLQDASSRLLVKSLATWNL